MKDLGIDVSHWRPKLIPDKIKGHVKWISAKAVEVDDRLYNGWNANMSVDQFVDDTWAGHCQTAYDIGAACMPFIFVNTIYKSEFYASSYADHVRHPNGEDPEILALRQALKNKTYHAFGIDCERWWRRYTPYLAMLRGEISGALVETVPSLWIRNSIEDTFNRVREEMRIGNFRDVPIIFYFGRWFIIGYCPELDTFLQDKLQWATHYRGPVYDAALKTSATNLGTWEQLKAIIASTTFSPSWTGNKPPEALQLTDKYFLPGVVDTLNRPLSVDVDITMVDMSVIFKDAPTAPPVIVPPVEPPVTVTKYYAKVRQDAYGLKLRAGPSTAAPILDYDFRPVPRFEIDGEPQVIGTITWASLGKAFFAIKQNSSIYADITTETK